MALLSGMKVKMPEWPVVAGPQFKSKSALTRRIPSLFTASQTLCSLPRFASYRASSFDAGKDSDGGRLNRARFSERRRRSRRVQVDSIAFVGRTFLIGVLVVPAPVHASRSGFCFGVVSPWNCRTNDVRTDRTSLADSMQTMGLMTSGATTFLPKGPSLATERRILVVGVMRAEVAEAVESNYLPLARPRSTANHRPFNLPRFASFPASNLDAGEKAKSRRLNSG